MTFRRAERIARSARHVKPESARSSNLGQSGQWYYSSGQPSLQDHFDQLHLVIVIAMATPLKRKAGDIATSTAKKPKANATITSFFSSPSSAAKPATAAQSTASSTIPSSPATVLGDASEETSTSTTATTASIFTSAAVAPPLAEAAAPLSKFDKKKWVEKLTPEQKDLLALEIASLDESWLSQLKDEIVTKDFLNLKRFLKKEHEAGQKIFPPAADVYSWYVRNPKRQS